jgi:aspartate/methionine/tyrosine aminotransferase
MAGGIPVEVPTSVESDFKITADQLEKAITPKTKMIWYSSPCNPSGSVYSREELTALAKVIEKHPNIYIVSDEIYEHINFSGTFCSIASIPGMFDRTITVNGVAKAFAMTGWRIGYIGAPEFIAKACTKMQGQVTSGANSIAQRATIAAVDADPSVLKDMVAAFHSRRDLVVRLMQEIPGIQLNTPEGAFYVFPDVSSFFGKTLRGKTINNADDFSMYLLAEAGVATVTGDAFGNPTASASLTPRAKICSPKPSKGSRKHSLNIYARFLRGFFFGRYRASTSNTNQVYGAVGLYALSFSCSKRITAAIPNASIGLKPTINYNEKNPPPRLRRTRKRIHHRRPTHRANRHRSRQL